jgi:AhpD family alkylhydroperoxidase
LLIINLFDFWIVVIEVIYSIFINFLKSEVMKQRHEVYQEIEQMMGLVPTMFKSLPDSSIELEWELFKKVQIEETAIPNKYRELIGVGVAAVMKCRYCSYYHTEIAKLYGATDAEIEDAVHFAKSSAGWSSYINGLQVDFDLFKAEIDDSCEHLRHAHMEKTHEF